MTVLTYIWRTSKFGSKLWSYLTSTLIWIKFRVNPIFRAVKVLEWLFSDCEDELINMTRAWDKEKFWVPDRNRTHDLPNTGRALYPLSYENSWRVRSFNWVHVNSSGGHGFDSCRGLRIFLSPTLVSCWLIHLHISLPGLKFTIFINLFSDCFAESKRNKLQLIHSSKGM